MTDFEEFEGGVAVAKAPEEEQDIVKELLYTKMKEAVTLKVPLEVDVNIGKDWL